MAAAMNFDCCELPFCVCCTCCPVGPQKQRKIRRKAICKDESSKEPLKNRYQPAVLVGNWIDRRANYEAPPPEYITVYRNSYTCKNNPDLNDDKRANRNLKILVEEGLGRDLLINQPGRAFRDNFTTTNDLIYRVLPHGLCGPRSRKYYSRLDRWLPEIDLAKNFGNLTDLGLKEHMECYNILARKPSIQQSIHKRDFASPGLPVLTSIKRYPKPKADFNEPDLSHLNIDFNEPYKPRLLAKD